RSWYTTAPTNCTTNRQRYERISPPRSGWARADRAQPSPGAVPDRGTHSEHRVDTLPTSCRPHSRHLGWRLFHAPPHDTCRTLSNRFGTDTVVDGPTAATTARCRSRLPGRTDAPERPRIPNHS